ncbi:MAG: hypothetical protein AVW06_00245 [Hadesarchaea archaeon DG-33-1]|nr:MAG: hypothetical protein AVW06_00245 [Hadesarchaea archaeon DG-33-1]
MRGQSSLEYILIVGLALILLASVTIARIVNPASKSASDVLRISQARSACDGIAGAMNGVYGNAQGATKTVWVHLSDIWDLQITKDPPKLRLSIRTSGGTENLEDNLRYGFDNSLLDIPAGSYAVVVDWSVDEEGITRSDNKIYIHINPLIGVGN